MNVLIVDDENEIAEIIEFVIQEKFPGLVKVFFANSDHEAMAVLFDSQIDICICDHKLSQGNGLDVLKYIIKQNLKTKFVLCSSLPLKSISTPYPLEHIFYQILKPEIFEGISQVANLLLSNSEEEYVIKEEYIPISIELLFIMEKMSTDVYLKINNDTFLKSLNRGDIFSINEKGKYIDKEIEYLYLKKTSFNTHVDQDIINEIEKLLHKTELSLSEKMCIAHSQFCELVKLSGLTPELVQAIKDNVKYVTENLMKENLPNEFWKKYRLKGAYSSQYFTLHAFIAAAILKKLKWSIETSIFKTTMAAFFQDIFLDSPYLMQIYDYSDFINNEIEFNRHDKKIFLEHPQKARELLVMIRNLPPGIDKLILDHHEMPDEKGFPKKLGAKTLDPLSCLFILCGILARYILVEGHNFNLHKFLEKFEKRGYAEDNFKDVFNAIKKL